MGKTRQSANLVSDNNIFADITNDRVGIKTSSPTSDLDVLGDARVTGIITANSFVKDGGTSSQFLKADGSVDSTTYLTSYTETQNLDDVLTSGNVSSNGMNVGVITASSFVGNITGTAATFTGNVSIAGTLTYEDVTNVDSIGIVTARTGIKVLAGGIDAVGVVTATSGVDLSGFLREQVNITAGKLSDNTNINLENGMVHLFTTTETTTSTPNVRYSASESLNSLMNVGESITVAIITTAAAAGYSAQLTIDGSAVTEKWLGGSAPSSGGASGNDVYTYNIIKTASATFTVLANVVNFA